MDIGLLCASRCSNQHLKNNLERKTCSKVRLCSFLPNHGRPANQLDENWSSPLTRAQLRKVLGREPPRQSTQQVGSKAVYHFLENRRKLAKSVVSHQVVAIRHSQVMPLGVASETTSSSMVSWQTRLLTTLPTCGNPRHASPR